MMSIPATMSHAERMDRKYRYTRHVFDITRKYFLFGREAAISSIPARPGDVIIDIGCGTGRNIPIIAGRFPHCRIIGIDISTEMLKSAEKRTRKLHLEGQVELRLGDAESISPAMFAGIVGEIHLLMSYSISMVPNWRKALAGAFGTIRDCGSLTIVDFGDFSGLPDRMARLCIDTLGRHDAPPCLSLATDINEFANPRLFCSTSYLSPLGWYRILQVKTRR